MSRRDTERVLSALTAVSTRSHYRGLDYYHARLMDKARVEKFVKHHPEAVGPLSLLVDDQDDLNWCIHTLGSQVILDIKLVDGDLTLPNHVSHRTCITIEQDGAATLTATHDALLKYTYLQLRLGDSKCFRVTDEELDHWVSSACIVDVWVKSEYDDEWCDGQLIARIRAALTRNNVAEGYDAGGGQDENGAGPDDDDGDEEGSSLRDCRVLFSVDQTPFFTYLMRRPEYLIALARDGFDNLGFDVSKLNIAEARQATMETQAWEPGSYPPIFANIRSQAELDWWISTTAVHMPEVECRIICDGTMTFPVSTAHMHSCKLTTEGDVVMHLPYAALKATSFLSFNAPTVSTATDPWVDQDEWAQRGLPRYTTNQSPRFAMANEDVRAMAEEVADASLEEGQLILEMRRLSPDGNPYSIIFQDDLFVVNTLVPALRNRGLLRRALNNEDEDVQPEENESLRQQAKDAHEKRKREAAPDPEYIESKRQRRISDSVPLSERQALDPIAMERKTVQQWLEDPDVFVIHHPTSEAIALTREVTEQLEDRVYGNKMCIADVVMYPMNIYGFEGSDRLHGKLSDTLSSENRQYRLVKGPLCSWQDPHSNIIEYPGTYTYTVEPLFEARTSSKDVTLARRPRKAPVKRKTPTKRKTPAKRNTPTKRNTPAKRKTSAMHKTPAKRKTPAKASAKRRSPAKRKPPTPRRTATISS
ncbi:hypothetical protein JKP88DRAFT_244906 [Tribonema minus]|uniref:Uncharacterized protein n=1 Tax=Tribonema minus TaxID=303371 RepID=A0A835YYC9_9STRA|nr:hypothetical protein JKP88DRAFT_244906 [Tribonema minus]